MLQVVALPEPSFDGRSEKNKSWQYSFDRVFRPHETQATVFDEIGQLVQSALDGYKVQLQLTSWCLLATSSLHMLCAGLF